MDWLISYGDFGCGIGLGYFPLVTNSWKYFPEKKGLLSGIILCCFGMGSFFWTFIADKMINPDEGKVQSSGDDKGYYSIEIAEKILNFWLFMIFASIVSTVIVGFLAFDFYEDENNEKSTSLVKSETKEEKKKIDTKLILRIFFSWEYSRVVVMQVGTNIFLYLVSVTMRPFGETIKNLPVDPLQKLSLVTSIVNGLSRIVWGFIIDLLGIKICLYTNIIIYIASSGTYYFLGGNIVLYYIINILTTLANSGNSILMPMVNKQLCGDIFLIVWGYAGIYYGLSSWIGPIFVKVLNIKERGEVVYMITYLICCGFCVNSLILAFFIGDKPIDYNKYKSHEELNIEMKKTGETPPEE